MQMFIITVRRANVYMLLSPVMHTDCTNARESGNSCYVYVCATPDGKALYFARSLSGRNGKYTRKRLILCNVINFIKKAEIVSIYKNYDSCFLFLYGHTYPLPLYTRIF